MNDPVDSTSDRRFTALPAIFQMKVWVRHLALAVLCSSCTGAALAQQYPTKGVRIIVPFGAGTGADLAARILADKLGKAMGQAFIVENRVGAGGIRKLQLSCPELLSLTNEHVQPRQTGVVVGQARFLANDG